MASKYGYPLEAHKVVTQDDFILEMHRIPFGRNSKKACRNGRLPVLVQHGLGGSSADWVLSGPGKALGKL